MIILQILEYGFAIIVGGLFGYQLLLSIFALKGKKINGFATTYNRRFVIALVAHNKEKIIAKTLYSLYNLVYPKNLYDVVVIADNCSDDTAKISRSFGSVVIERSESQEIGTGYTLRWAIDKIMDWDKNYDAVIIVNAESLVSGNYLEVMNYYLDKGSQVIQSSNLSFPQTGGWHNQINRLGLLLYNFVRPMGRKVLGFNTELRGNGICLSTELLRKIPWKTWSLKEEVEYGLMLLLHGVSIDFAPEARVWGKYSSNIPNFRRYDCRQISRYPIIKKYAPKLLGAFFSEKALRHFDTFIDLITPSLKSTFSFVFLMCGLNVLLWKINWIPVQILWIWLMVAIVGVLHLIIGLYAAGEDRELYKSAVYIPLVAYCILSFM